ncbi:DUF397 domain-containing protein [Streptomyces griseoviridis]|uniref:DUF397 domain-containing protein n=1 Tax=Streptomyces griseoviridis TaxID=45398 RepID=UPI003422EFBC
MRVPRDLSDACWRKSSHSDGQQGGACVEVSVSCVGTVPVRDSKNTSGPILMLDGSTWQTFVDGVKDGSL